MKRDQAGLSGWNWAASRRSDVPGRSAARSEVLGGGLG